MTRREVVRGVRSAIKSGVTGLPGGKAALAALTFRRHRDLIIASRLFDREYYETACGERFRNEREAVEHYLVHGRAQGFPPNPLFEQEWFTPKDRPHRSHPLVRYIQRGPGKHGPGSLFDAEQYLLRVPRAASHPGGPMGHFIANAKPGDLVPVSADFPGKAPTWGDLYSRMLEVTRIGQVHRSLRGNRRFREWDTERERAFLDRWLTAPVPGAAGTGRSATPVVSVIMPVRNRPVQVLDAIESVIAQTFPDWELLVVDDGSTDETPQVLAAQAEADPRVRVVRIEPSGVSAARNAGIEAARGRFVAFLDSDNTWVRHFLQVTLASMTGEGHRVAYCVVEAREIDGRVTYLAFDGGLDHLLIQNHIDLNALVVETALVREVDGFDPSLRRWVDYDLVTRLARLSPPVLLPFVGVQYDADEGIGDRITRTESDHWEFVVLGKHWVDWAALERGLPDRVPGRVSVAMPTYQDWRMTLDAVRAVLANSGDADIEVVVVDNGSRRSVASVITATFAGDPRVKVVMVPRNIHFANGSNIGFAQSTGETVIFLNNDTEVRPGWLPPLLAGLQDPEVRGVQPLLVYGDDTVQSAGSVLPGGDLGPTAFLANHPVEDARKAGPLRLPVVTAAALAMRAEEVVSLRGFDPIYVNGFEDVDLCLRAVEARGGSFLTSLDSVVRHFESRTPGRGTRIPFNRRIWLERWRGRMPGSDLHHYERIGFEVAHLDPGRAPEEPGDVSIPKPVLIRRARLVTQGPAEGLPSLRWAIKIAAPAGAKGDGWGDVHFAQSLARALQRLGQDVVIDRREAVHRTTGYLDDVVLVLRGLDEIAHIPGRVNLMWVISHPELVTPAELLRYDRTLAASVSWSAAMSERTGLTVEPLLQATAPDRFHPDLPRLENPDGVLFVGTSRNVYRTIVRDAVEAGLDPAIYGGGWAQFGVEAHVRADYLPNEELGRAYASAGVVLNDHWADMAEQGFVSNRLFDAVACGARVVSDAVEGVEELFGGAVQVYRDQADLARLCGSGRDAAFPDEEARRAIAKRVCAEHSFDARARRLLDAALSVSESAPWSLRGSARIG